MVNRCLGINKNNKHCRCITKNNQLFCCESHKPINKEIIEHGCFICTEKINTSKELIYFKCKHAFHKECYNDWLKYSTYDKHICLICRTEFNPSFKSKKIKKIFNKIPMHIINEKIIIIKDILNKY